MRGGGEGSVGVIGAGTSDWLREDFYNVEMQRERPGRQGLRDLQLDMTDGFAKRFTLDDKPVDEPAGSFSLLNVAMASRLLDRSAPRVGRLLGLG